MVLRDMSDVADAFAVTAQLVKEGKSEQMLLRRTQWF